MTQAEQHVTYKAFPLRRIHPLTVLWGRLHKKPSFVKKLITWCRIVIYSDFTRSIEEAARIGAASTDLLVRVRHQWLGGVTRQACSTAILRGRLRAVHTTELQEPPSNADIRTLLVYLIMQSIAD